MSDITFIQKNTKLKNDVKEYIEEKLLKHKKLLDKAISITVLTKFNKNYPPDKKYGMEISVDMPHTFIKVEDRGSSPQELVDLLEVNIKRKLTRYNQQFKKWEKHEPWKISETNELLPTLSDETDFIDYEPQVKKEEVETTRALHLGEAVERMDMSGRNAYFFKNMETNKYAMLYRSPNQEYILIQSNE